MRGQFRLPRLRSLVSLLIVGFACGNVSESQSEISTCASCKPTRYGCVWSSTHEAFDLVVSSRTQHGCALDYWEASTRWELHCDPLEVCGATGCQPAINDNGALRWTTGGIQVECQSSAVQ